MPFFYETFHGLNCLHKITHWGYLFDVEKCVCVGFSMRFMFRNSAAQDMIRVEGSRYTNV